MNRINKKYLFLGLLITVLGLGFVACERGDDEPIQPARSISRLYVSVREFELNETLEPIRNLLSRLNVFYYDE